MNPTNRERDVMASLGSLADAVEEVVESAPWMLEAAGGQVFAYDDGSVCPVIDPIAGTELHAPARRGGVDRGEWLAATGGARRARW